jgi:hypothetical protein
LLLGRLTATCRAMMLWSVKGGARSMTFCIKCTQTFPASFQPLYRRRRFFSLGPLSSLALLLLPCLPTRKCTCIQAAAFPSDSNISTIFVLSVTLPTCPFCRCINNGSTGS